MLFIFLSENTGFQMGKTYSVEVKQREYGPLFQIIPVVLPISVFYAVYDLAPTAAGSRRSALIAAFLTAVFAVYEISVRKIKDK